MTTALSLHHIGEVVLRGLLGSLTQHQRLDAVSCELHSACNLSSVLNGANVKAPLHFEVNAPLAPIELHGKKVLFDGAHGVDVLCHDGVHGLAIEAKLGLDRLSSAAFGERFLEPVELSKHRSPRFKGSMTAILNHRGLADGTPLDLHTKAPSVELVAPWFLVVRRATWLGWGSARPGFSGAHVALFEDIASAHGDANEFDRLVTSVVGGGFYTAWKVGE